MARGLEEARSATSGGGRSREVERAAQEADLAARGLEEVLSAASGGGRSHGSVARLEVEKAAAQAQCRAQREENTRLGARLREKNTCLEADLAERGLVEALSKASGGN